MVSASPVLMPEFEFVPSLELRQNLELARNSPFIWLEKAAKHTQAVVELGSPQRDSSFGSGLKPETQFFSFNRSLDTPPGDDSHARMVYSYSLVPYGSPREKSAIDNANAVIGMEPMRRRYSDYQAARTLLERNEDNLSRVDALRRIALLRGDYRPDGEALQNLGDVKSVKALIRSSANHTIQLNNMERVQTFLNITGENPLILTDDDSRRQLQQGISFRTPEMRDDDILVALPGAGEGTYVLIASGNIVYTKLGRIFEHTPPGEVCAAIIVSNKDTIQKIAKDREAVLKTRKDWRNASGTISPTLEQASKALASVAAEDTKFAGLKIDISSTSPIARSMQRIMMVIRDFDALMFEDFYCTVNTDKVRNYHQWETDIAEGRYDPSIPYDQRDSSKTKTGWYTVAYSDLLDAYIALSNGDIPGAQTAIQRAHSRVASLYRVAQEAGRVFLEEAQEARVGNSGADAEKIITQYLSGMDADNHQRPGQMTAFLDDLHNLRKASETIFN